MAGVLRGGANQTTFHAVSAGTANTTAAHTLDKNVSTTLTPQDDGSWLVEWDSKQDTSALDTFLDTYGPPPGTTTTEPESYTFEDGTTDSVSGTSSQTGCVVIVFGPEDGTNRKTFTGWGYVQPGSGGYSQEFGKSTSPKVSFKTSLPDVEITVPIAAYDSALCVPAAATTLEVTSYGKVLFVPLP